MRQTHPFEPSLKLIVLVGSLVVAAARLIGFGFEFAGEALQADFSAYYTAGQMIAADLSPYRYLITPARIIWTSSDTYQHSQYIYPPLLAVLFAPVTQVMPYLVAKYAWWLLDLVCLALVITFSRLSLRLSLKPWGLAYVAFAGLFHPVIVQLLRGQIDLVTSTLIWAAFLLLTRRRSEGLAGGLLGIAALIKFHAAFMFPFLLIRRKFRAAIGFAVAALLMIILNVVIAGPDHVQAYLAEVPRISQYGGDGPPGSELSPGAMALLAHLFPPEGGVYKDGFLFDHPGFEFVTNASFVELICCGLGFNLQRTTASLAVGIFFVVVFGLLESQSYLFTNDNRPKAAVKPDAGRSENLDEFLYWFAVANIALLAGPTTWAMNVVWLLPGFAIVVYLWKLSERGSTLLPALVLAATGLLLVAMPDHRSFPALFPRALLRLSIYKYPLGEFLMILGMLIHLRHRRLTGSPTST